MRDITKYSALIGVGAALSAFTILREVGPHDEGLMLQAAARVAGGQWPYRDFWFNYGPGQPLVLAALWKAFGPSLLAWRVLRTDDGPSGDAAAKALFGYSILYLFALFAVLLIENRVLLFVGGTGT